MPSKREPLGADFKARRRRFIAIAGSCPSLPDVPAIVAADIPRECGTPAEGGAGGRTAFARIRAMRERLPLDTVVSAKDLINEGRRI
jgi:hypothetical protein